MFRLSAFSFAVLSASLFTSTALAQDSSGVYGTLGLTQLSTDIDLRQTTISGQTVDLGNQSPDINMLTGRLGYRINSFIVLEGEAGFGLGGDDFSQAVPVTVAGTAVNVDTTVGLDVKNYYAGFARAILPLSDDFDVFIRGGYGSVKAEADVLASAAGLTASASASESVDGFAYGIGGQYNFSAKDGVRLDYSQIDEASILSVSYARRF